MATRTYRRFCKGYGPNSALNLYGSTISRSIFLLGDLDKLFKPSILLSNPIPTLDTPFTIISIAKYTEKNL